ncbi:MAG: hypothetical protein FD167_2892, partial [bacterium]
PLGQAGIPSINPLAAINNVLVNNPNTDAGANDTQSETSIAVAGNGNLVVGYNDSGSLAFGDGNHFTGYSFSTNGGTSFTDVTNLPDDPSGDGDAGDPIIDVNRTNGNVYMATLGFNIGNLRVFRSTDNGATFGTPVNGSPGSTGFQDKEWIAVDNFAGTGQGNVYLAWRNFNSTNDMRLTRSTDNGATFGNNIQIATGGQGANIVVGTDHSLYYFWYNSSATPRRITLRKSTDFGATFGTTITAANLVGTGVNGDLALTGGFRSNSFPQAAVNPVNGHIYVVYNDVSAITGGDRGNIFFTMSTDGGATFSTPTRVNNDVSTTAQQYTPTVTVTPNGQSLFIGFYDRRLDPSNALIDRFGVIGSIASGSGAVTFGPNFRITRQSFPVVVGVDPQINTTYMGDYDQSATDGTFFYDIWGDNSDRNLANTRNQANIRSAKFSINGPGAILGFNNVAIVADGDSNGRIDINESASLNVSLLNGGTGTASGVTATLSTTTPGVTVTTPNANYPNIAAGLAATNATPFVIMTSPSFVCGTMIQLSLNVNTTGDGTFTVPFSVPSGGLGTAMPFESVNVPVNILDVATVNSVTNVSGLTGAVGKVTVSFFLTHTFDADLDIFLIGPDGTTVELTTDNGSLDDNYGTSCANRTVFDDAAAMSITAGIAPFVGTFRPEGMLSAFNGKPGNGTWTLRITDDLGGDVGVLMCWGLQISPLICNGGGGGGPVLDRANIIVADTLNSRLQMSTNNGSSWSIVGTQRFNNVQSVASNNTGSLIFVAETGTSRILRSTNAGSTFSVIVGPGVAPGT